MITLEICAQSYQAALNAFHHGAHRIELCTKLSSGGLTPGGELIRQVKESIRIPVFVLIRPRGGNFEYTAGEVQQIIHEIKRSIDHGADGIVCGTLDRNNKINRSALEQIIQACQGLPFTFHRAFESLPHPLESLDLLVNAGVDRILTGGSTGNAYQSRHELAELNAYAQNRITILAGSGVTKENVVQLIRDAKLHEVHASAKYGSPALDRVDPYDTNPMEVIELLQAIHSLG